MKTELTKEIEHKLSAFTHIGNGLGTYSCFETSIYFRGWAEYVDYITMDSNEIFRCYEIKVSRDDFYSKALKTFVGNFNYFVMPRLLYEQLIQETEPINQQPPLRAYIGCNGIGVYVYENGKFTCVKKAKKQQLVASRICELMHAMIRSMEKYVHV